MAGKYTTRDGTALDLDNQDSFDLAVTDLGARMADLEGREKLVSENGGPDGARLARLEAVVGKFFNSEFRDYDDAHKSA